MLKGADVRYWAVFCREDYWPGLWRLWEEQQVTTFGYPSSSYEKRKGNRGWITVMNRLSAMKSGDRIVARLPGHRIGRVGSILSLKVADADWDPLIPKSRWHSIGEQGRKIFVRWDFSIGPTSKEFCCVVPQKCRFNSGEVRKTINELTRRQFESLEKALSDSSNWEPVFAHKFRDESALSGFIASNPESLNPDLHLYAFTKTREKKLGRADRADILLQDAEGNPVVVECKQGKAFVEYVFQLRRYMKRIKREFDLHKSPRGILVFGGAPVVTEDVRREASRRPIIELFSYRLDVLFQRAT